MKETQRLFTSAPIYATDFSGEQHPDFDKRMDEILNNERRHEIIVAAVKSGKSARRALKIADKIMGTGGSDE